MAKNLISKRFLYLIAAAIWGIPGFIITAKGITAYTTMPTGPRLYFGFMFCH